MSDIIRSENNDFEINPLNIKRSAYTNTLLDEAVRVGAVTDDDVTAVQISVMNALEAAINLYTKEESTSIMTETAQDLLKSVLVCIDEYLVSLESHKTALDTLLTKNSVDLYLLGYRQLKALVLEAVSLMVKLKKSRLDIDNRRYEQTIEKFIPELLKSYDPHYDALYTISHFYPLGSHIPKSGAVIRGLILYMNALLEENRFCSQISGVKLLYSEYMERHSESASFEGSNIYAVILHNAIFAILAGRKPGTLRVDIEDCHKLSRTLGQLPREILATKLAEAAIVLEIGNPSYAMNTLNLNLPQIANALNHNSLQNIIVAY